MSPPSPCIYRLQSATMECMKYSRLNQPLIDGFTLIELIIVIAILGILTVASGAAYIATMRTSRDGRRKVDLESLRSALEMYHSDYSTYPHTDATHSLASFLEPASGKKYISMPKDPQTKQDYAYESNGCVDINGTMICNNYTLGAVLENTSVGASSGCPAGCTTCSFCVNPYGPLPTVTPNPQGGMGEQPTATPTPTPDGGKESEEGGGEEI